MIRANVLAELENFFQQVHASGRGLNACSGGFARPDADWPQFLRCERIRRAASFRRGPRAARFYSSFMLSSESILQNFPILDRKINGHPLVYLDNAATTQKPLQVLYASRHYYEAINSNIHRGTHFLARLATEAFEQARQTVASHLNADSSDEVIFTSGTTDAINLVSSVLTLSGQIGKGDEILISTLEHHSNIVPWQMLCVRTGAELKVIPCDENGVLDQHAFHELLSNRTKVLALGWVSNAFGTVNPVREMTAAAKKAGALVLIDAAQAAPHLKMDVQSLGADFLAFSGHKVYAPTGIGVLWGRRKVLEDLPPWRGGGEMIKEVTFDKTTYNDLPFKYEAGTRTSKARSLWLRHWILSMRSASTRFIATRMS